ncbi:MAG TPA: hypothetical protein VGG20_17195 [Thermoanaerobaculia bacterium]|jgi:hypothetical protein
MSDWETMGAVDPRALIDARLQLHWAAQAAAAVGKQLLPHQPDFSEQSLEWLAGPRVLAQGVIEGKRPFRPAIHLANPALMLLDESGGTICGMQLEGHTFDEAYEWMEREVEALVGRPFGQPLERSEGLPAHPVSMGAQFSFSMSPALAELDRYYAGADRLLRALRDANPEASPVRCWPHHFDLATLLRLDPEADPEEARSIGVGLSPGDGTFAEPYFYLLPWPRPAGELPKLDGGHWHTEGWIGAVLEASEFTSGGSNGTQRERIERFLTSAVSACRRLLESHHE